MNEFELIFAILENLQARLDDIERCGDGGALISQSHESVMCRELLERLRPLIPTK